MSRNIWLTFEEWTAIKEQVNPEKWWCYELSARELKEWKSDIKKGYGDQWCFKRAGVPTKVLNKLTTPYLYNRLLQENYRGGEMQDMFIGTHHFESFDEQSLNNFISWATATIDGVDMNTTKEQWIAYNKALKIAVENSNKRVIFAWEMENLFRSVTVGELVQSA